MAILHDPSEIPPFASEDDEAEFWATHRLGPELLDQAEPIPKGERPPPRPSMRACMMPAPSVSLSFARASRNTYRIGRRRDCACSGT
jgi:hypothetical protein